MRPPTSACSSPIGGGCSQGTSTCTSGSGSSGGSRTSGSTSTPCGGCWPWNRRLLICDHAGILENAQEKLAGKIRWWEELGEKAQELQGRGLGIDEITRRLLGREGFLSWFSLGDFSQKNLIRKLLDQDIS